jgi:hypothetical protein
VARRIIVAALITIVVLSAARRLTFGRPTDIGIDREGLGVRHRTVTEHIGPGRPVVEVHVTPTEGVSVSAVYRVQRHGEPREISLERSENGLFRASLPELGKGSRLRYAIIVSAPGGVSIRIPERPDRYVLLKYKGKVSTAVLTAHIACMFGSFFFMILSLFAAIRILRGLEGKAATVRAARWALTLSFVGGWPLGFVLNREAFGTIWEGYPFGYDVTDNKTQIMFVFWLVSLLLVRGSFFGRGEAADTLGARGFARVIIASFIVSLALFILPHSL